MFLENCWAEAVYFQLRHKSLASNWSKKSVWNKKCDRNVKIAPSVIVPKDFKGQHIIDEGAICRYAKARTEVT